MSDVIAALPFVPEAVIFDMDGLMLDSERASLRSWSRGAREIGLQIEDAFWLRLVGHSMAACQLILRERMEPAQIEALLARCMVLYREEVDAGVPLRPGIHEILQLLAQHGIPCGVATSTRRPLAPHKLETAGLLPYFKAVTAGDDVEHPKPAPDIYLLAAQRMGAAPERCLALEDSPAGVTAALAAGLTVIQVPDLVVPDEALRARGHRIVASLHHARELLEACLLAA
ncbi:HAD family phosphatase [Pseudoxanthomonas sp.]|uniref:HAD family hydrolase n=1 Tax=Pseudoxanthomonas sp. TaxID=1871049 RepID=UPI002638516A|nr:HAD family phosphatase [Pseudoxanthomonas sp.]WDS34647.1 MAG: HAD family phosphatase [Pseudoxanthomonas sp.]